MKQILSAGSLYTLPLENIFEIAGEVGFDGVEIIINYDFQYGDNATMIRQLQKIHPVAALHAPFLILDNWGNRIEQLQRTIHLARETGVPLVNFHPPAWLALELRFWTWLKGLTDMQRELAGNEVLVTIENMPCSGPLGVNPYVLASTDKMIEFMESHNLLMTFDTAHMGSSRANFIHDFHRFYNTGRMRNIHFSDYGYGREHLLPGHGVLPLTRFLNHLRETGYDATITLELSPAELPERQVEIVESLAVVLDYLRTETRG
ncbi:MAG: sugar phosphate isomerase/epimerase [Desulfuromonas sp.]|nr:MAG: sugar phosphate isomerase/epimerase [Desulfuromonas sp.]